MILAYYVRHQLCPPLQGTLRFPNISAKHEGKDSEIEAAFTHPSDILNRYLAGILSPGDMPHLELNYLDKHSAVNRTAKALTERDLGFVAAWHLHRRNWYSVWKIIPGLGKNRLSLMTRRRYRISKGRRVLTWLFL